MTPPYPDSGKSDYSAAELTAAVDRNEARIAAAEAKIAAALAPEPMDWDANHFEILATIAAQAARLDALTTDGGA